MAIDEEGERTLVRLAGLSGLLGLGLAWWSLRSVLLTAIVFACGVSQRGNVAWPCMAYWPVARCDLDVDAIAGLCAVDFWRGALD